MESYWRGRWDESMEEADAFLDEVDAGNPHPVGELFCRSVRAQIRLARGDTANAIVDGEKAVDVAREWTVWGFVVRHARRARAHPPGRRQDRGGDALVTETIGMGLRDVTYAAPDLATALVDLGRQGELGSAIEASPTSLWLDAAKAFVAGDCIGAAELYAEIGSVPYEADARLRIGPRRPGTARARLLPVGGGDPLHPRGRGTARRDRMSTARRERKVVTVLFADLVGFTSRAESLDPEDVEAILRPYHERLRDELERHGGTVEKFIGDAVMALFGAPVAHEDDPERAVRAALAIRDWRARKRATSRCGSAITTGEALVSLDARPEAGEGMASGDVVNTAARLQAAAPVNGILVGETTYRATDAARSTTATAEPVEAKGKAEPVPVWEALERALALRRRRRARGAHAARRPASASSTCSSTRSSARGRSGAPQLVTLVGVPGIGKSRLVLRALPASSRPTPSSSPGGRAARSPTARASRSGRSARW